MPRALWMGFFVYEHSWCPTEHTFLKLFTVADSREAAAELMAHRVTSQLGHPPYRGFIVSDIVGPWLGFQQIAPPVFANTLAMYEFTFVDPDPRRGAGMSIPARVEELMR